MEREKVNKLIDNNRSQTRLYGQLGTNFLGKLNGD